MARGLPLVALLVASTVSRAAAQTRPDTTARGPQVTLEYDAETDSTTRSLSAFAIVDTSLAPPDTFAVELTQRWKGRGSSAPIAVVELGLGRARATGLRASRTLRWNAPGRPPIVFVLDGTRRIRVEQSEYVSNGGGTLTFETARYRLAPNDLRAIAACTTLQARVGDREVWIDPAWRSVAADMVAGQTPRAP